MKLQLTALALCTVGIAGGLLVAPRVGHGGPTVAKVLDRYGPAAKAALEPACKEAGIAWPPKRVTLLAFKQERSLEVWGANATGRYARLALYPILAASGGPGPKTREGDMQVPEGEYRITTLNPASRFHLSLRVDYPNAADRAHAQVPADKMGGDIYVHGNRVSIGCIAIGDDAIEKVFCVVALARPAHRRIVIAPVDLRRADAVEPPAGQPWVRGLYRRLRTRLAEFKI